MSTQYTTKQRESWLDLIKGMIILLVVLIHVMQGIQVAGYGLSYKWLLQFFFVLTDFAMPLFFAMSGYLYTWERPSDWGDYKKLVAKKMIRLGIPYILFSTVQGTFRILLSNQTNMDFERSNLFSMLLQPFDQFWFLYSLLSIFLLIPLFDLLLRKRVFVLLFLLISGLILHEKTPLPFLNFALTNGFYFYLGVYLNRYRHGLADNRLLLLAAGLVYVVSRAQLGFEMNQHPQFVSILLAITGSLLTLYCGLHLIAPNRTLRSVFNMLGLYSFEIYLLHVLLAAPTRMMLLRLYHIENFWIHLLAGLMAGLLIPILISRIAGKIPALEFCFYPGKYIGQKRRVSAAPV